MNTTESPRWRERATEFFSASGVKIKQAGQSAGTLMGEVVKDTGQNVSGAAERMSSLVRTRWALMQKNTPQQPKSSNESVQERIISAAASTSTLLRRSVSETKDKVTAGKLKVEEAAKKTADKGKDILTNIERWQKGVADNDVFGVPIEVTVQRQKTSKPVPEVLVKCAEYLVLSGLHTEYLFKKEGDEKTVQRLISLYNNDWDAPLPDGIQPIDVATLVKCYLASLPEPLSTFALYHEIRTARSSISDLKRILTKLPNVNYVTLEFITALLLHVSQKSSLNMMDSQTLSMEFASLLIWQKGDEKADLHGHLSYMPKGNSRAMEFMASRTAQDNLSDDEDRGTLVSSSIPLDDDASPDYHAIEVIQCLIEHHNTIFTDANETVWS